MLRHRGRTASYPTTPAQIPACGIPAPGSSVVLASASRRLRRVSAGSVALPLDVGSGSPPTAPRIPPSCNCAGRCAD